MTLALPALEALIPPWMAQAACLDHNPDLFFPTQNGPSIAAAHRICQSCPVAETCAQYAIDEDIPHGIWGGMSENARRELRKHRDRKAS